MNGKGIYTDKLFGEIINYIIDRLKQDDFKKKIQAVLLDPMIEYIGRRLYPYVLFASLCFVFIILLFIFLIWTK